MFSGIHWLVVTIYMASKLTSAMFFKITYIFTSELFPTYTRNSMQALCSSLGRIGGIVATQMPLLVNILVVGHQNIFEKYDIKVK